jgi:FkbM family methyltransferase
MYEPQEILLVRSILRPGDVFVDVGANWGYFTLLAAHLVGAHGRVVALEPEPRSHALLLENCEENGLHNVMVLELAAAAAEGKVVLEGFAESEGNFGTSRVLSSGLSGPQAVDVRAQRLDEVLSEIGIEQVGLLKMDIEGSEGPALIGLEQFLGERRIDRFLVELHPAALADFGFSPEQVVRTFRDAGYRVWTIDHSPQATRTASYRVPEPDALIRSLGPTDHLDSWPHLLTARDGLTPLR